MNWARADVNEKNNVCVVLGQVWVEFRFGSSLGQIRVQVWLGVKVYFGSGSRQLNKLQTWRGVSYVYNKITRMRRRVQHVATVFLGI